MQQEYLKFIKLLKKYRRKLLLRNQFLNALFTGVKNALEINKEDIILKDYFYFRDYYDQRINHFYRNYARKRGNDTWEDYHLAPSRNLYYEDDPYSNYSPFYFNKVKPIPIFKLLRRKKQYTEIQNIYTLEIVKLLSASHSKIYRIHFPSNVNPDRPQKKSRIDYFFNPK